MGAAHARIASSTFFIVERAHDRPSASARRDCLKGSLLRLWVMLSWKLPHVLCLCFVLSLHEVKGTELMSTLLVMHARNG